MIGNSNYSVAPLGNASLDAALVAQRLTDLQFNVKTYYDLSFDEFSALQSEIGDLLRDAEIGIVYYSGHAVQIAGESNLLPVDLAKLDLDEIKSKKLPLETLVANGIAGEAGLRLFIIDACRNDPFSDLGGDVSATLDTEGGISIKPSAELDTLIAYAAGSGQLAWAGNPGRPGPYAVAMDLALSEPGLELTEITRRIARQVAYATNNQQTPWVSGSIRNEYWLNQSDVLRPPESPKPGLDEVLWWFLATSANPLTLERFLIFFQNSEYLDVAGARLDQLREAVDAPAAPRVAPSRPLAEVGAPIPADLFDIQRETLGDVPGGLRSIANDCDWLAADFADLQRVTPAVRSGVVRLEEAAQACVYALRADPENPRSAFQLGRVLETAGRFVWAQHFYLRAAQNGYAAALLRLGELYGLGFDLRSARRGYWTPLGVATQSAGIGFEENQELAHQYYREAASLGNLSALTNIGEQFLLGWGVPRDPVEALSWYRLASESGWVNAQNALADRYRRGEGTVTDLSTAAAIYELAALNGQRDAMHNLGRLLIRGDGVPQDRPVGREWLERGILAGDRFSPFSLARDLVATGESKKNADRVLDLLNLSWNRGNPRALLDLAWIYEKGEIVPRDYETAYAAAYRALKFDLPKSSETADRLEVRIGSARAAELRDTVDQELRLNGR